ncbi:MAG: hypothetical protein OXG08_06545 [Gammaproteobacteria bacterium]|nr:hypothetical protein [Gammaproteobacteria bacterium]
MLSFVEPPIEIAAADIEEEAELIDIEDELPLAFAGVAMALPGLELVDMLTAAVDEAPLDTESFALVVADAAGDMLIETIPPRDSDLGVQTTNLPLE